MRGATSLFALAFLLGGCIGAGIRENQPPTVRLDAVSTTGDAPFTVQWIEFAFDPDGDRLEVNMTDDAGRGGYDYTEVHAGGGTDNGTTLRFETRHTWTIYEPGTRVVTLTVSDGIHTVSDSVVITITGPRAFPGAALREFANVSADCARCSGAMIGSSAALGSEGCQGFLLRNNGTDCLWFALQPEWAGRTFYSNSTTGADVDLEMRTDCEPGPGKSIGTYIHDGYESAKVPKGALCAVLWTYRGAPATIEFRVE